MNIQEAHDRIIALMTATSDPFGEVNATLRRLQREARRQPCLKCGRFAGDLIHDDGNDHGGTGTSAMHPFIGEPEKYLLQLAIREVFMVSKAGMKGGGLNAEQQQWNVANEAARTQIEKMFAPIDPDELARHDQYFQREYAAQDPRLAKAETT